MPASAAPDRTRRWWILAVLGFAQLMVVLDVTIVNIALPSAQKALGFSDDSRQWIITAYALTFGSLLLIGGRIGDLFGRRRVFVSGLIGFAVASAIGGAAHSVEVLIAARALQGAFGALLAPAALSLLTTTFTEPRERATAIGVFGAIAGGAGALGLLAGGVLTEYLNWRWCLYVNLVFAIPAAIGAITLIPRQLPAARPRLDLPGTMLATSGLFAIVFGVSRAEAAGWAATSSIFSIAIGALLLIGFLLRQTRAAHPLLPLRIVLDRDRGTAYLTMALAGAGVFAVFLFLTYYLQQTLGYAPITSGLAFLPLALPVVVSAAFATAVLLPRVGPRLLVPAGMLLAATGIALLTRAGADSSYATDVLPGLLIMGIGYGLVFAPAMHVATHRVDHADAGVASAMVNVGQQIGGSIGIALLSTLAATATANQLAAPGAARDAIAQAAVHGYHTAFWWAAAISIAGGIIGAALFRSGTPKIDPAAEPIPAI